MLIFMLTCRNWYEGKEMFKECLKTALTPNEHKFSLLVKRRDMAKRRHNYSIILEQRNMDAWQTDINVCTKLFIVRCESAVGKSMCLVGNEVIDLINSPEAHDHRFWRGRVILITASTQQQLQAQLSREAITCDYAAGYYLVNYQSNAEINSWDLTVQSHPAWAIFDRLLFNWVWADIIKARLGNLF